MKIRLAILEADQSYLMRIVSVISTKYADQFEIYSFTDQDTAMKMLSSARIDILLANETFDIDISALPQRCGFAYFVESAGMDTVKGQKAICKFQKLEMIYKHLLNIYSEKEGSRFGMKEGKDEGKVILFTSVSGGAGASSVAAACALRYAKQGKRVLYLNLEDFGSADVFFKGEGSFDISDIIYGLKSKKTNLAIKLESCVKQDASGVCFYSQPKVALDMLELEEDEIAQLLAELRSAVSYDYIILDTDFTMNKKFLRVCRLAFMICWVGDGSEISNMKLKRAYEALSILEQREENPLTERLVLFYNKFSSKTGRVLEEFPVKNIGGAPKYEHAFTSQVVEKLSGLDMLDCFER